MVALSLKVYAQAADASVYHLRDRDGKHEVDFIIEGFDGQILVAEVKLSPTVSDKDVHNLHWLSAKLGDKLADAVLINTGTHAYRRPDGIAVIPAALLGP